MARLVDGRTTNISWTHHTFNLWWGCEHADADDPKDPAMVDMTAISEECAHCYAESFDHRLGGEHWGPAAEPRWASEDYWRKLAQWNARAEREQIRRRVFVSSMADWAQLHKVPAVNAKMDELRARLMYEIGARSWLDYLLLTKRAERLPELLPWVRTGEPPPRNVWVGVTIGTRRSMWRARYLRAVGAAVRFISCEPLLDDISAAEWDAVLSPRRDQCCDRDRDFDGNCDRHPNGRPEIDWLIIGDESGAGRRITDTADVEVARDAAERNGVAFHLKQLHDSDGKKVHLPGVADAGDLRADRRRDRVRGARRDRQGAAARPRAVRRARARAAAVHDVRRPLRGAPHDPRSSGRRPAVHADDRSGAAAAGAERRAGWCRVNRRRIGAAIVALAVVGCIAGAAVDNMTASSLCVVAILVVSWRCP